MPVSEREDKYIDTCQEIDTSFHPFFPFPHSALSNPHPWTLL